MLLRYLGDATTEVVTLSWLTSIVPIKELAATTTRIVGGGWLTITGAPFLLRVSRPPVEDEEERGATRLCPHRRKCPARRRVAGSALWCRLSPLHRGSRSCLNLVANRFHIAAATMVTRTAGAAVQQLVCHVCACLTSYCAAETPAQADAPGPRSAALASDSGGTDARLSFANSAAPAVERSQGRERHCRSRVSWQRIQRVDPRPPAHRQADNDESA